MIFINCKWFSTRWQWSVNCTRIENKQPYTRGEYNTQNNTKTPNTQNRMQNIYIKKQENIQSFSILSDDRSKASSKTIPPHSAI